MNRLHLSLSLVVVTLLLGIAAVYATNRERPRTLVRAGDTVRVRLLAGVNAPTDGPPYPTILRVLPREDLNDFSRKFGEARLVVSAAGSLADSRVCFRLRELNFRLPNGERKKITVDGWILDEDGIRGMAGKVFDPIARALARTSDEPPGSRNESAGDPLSFPREACADVEARMKVAEDWSAIIKCRACEIKPVVQVPKGHDGIAVFANSFELPH